jgi:hypothetical protein
MCFNIIQDAQQPLIAEKDIKVYKFLEMKYDRLRSPYFSDFNWHKGFLNETLLGIDKYGMLIYEGFHAYIDKEMCEIAAIPGCSIHTMIVPKGATYYINKAEYEIVSNQMILKN